MLVTLANFIAFVLLLTVFLLGGFVRLPRARNEIAAVERQQLRSEDARVVSDGVHACRLTWEAEL